MNILIYLLVNNVDWKNTESIMINYSSRRSILVEGTFRNLNKQFQTFFSRHNSLFLLGFKGASYCKFNLFNIRGFLGLNWWIFKNNKFQHFFRENIFNSNQSSILPWELGSCNDVRYHKKMRPDRFSDFDVYRRQAKYIQGYPQSRRLWRPKVKLCILS